MSVSMDLLIGCLIGSAAGVGGVVAVDELTACAPAAQTSDTVVVQSRRTNDQIRALVRCEDEGREAGSYRVYAACKAEAGLP